ncbi:hypothetical protein PC117_g5515 [Phytophthora cactorum]|nr:hypothetical protein PC117_g5515 [Phytophthora cactorum]KAG3096838.1 hypothetical protein PC122_g4779 [Phytophthora cactorum]
MMYQLQHLLKIAPVIVTLNKHWRNCMEKLPHKSGKKRLEFLV